MEHEEGEKVTWWLEVAPGILVEVDKDGALGYVQRKGGLRLRRWRLKGEALFRRSRVI